MAAHDVEARVGKVRPQAREGPQDAGPVFALPLPPDEEEAGVAQSRGAFETSRLRPKPTTAIFAAGMP